MKPADFSDVPERWVPRDGLLATRMKDQLKKNTAGRCFDFALRHVKKNIDHYPSNLLMAASL